MQPEEIRSYAGFTIGPIDDLMRHAKKTRELWFGSYFFSWYMETLISKLICREIGFVTPFADAGGDPPALKPNTSPAGKYHDRFVIQSTLPPDALEEKIRQINGEVIDYFADIAAKLAQTCGSKNGRGAIKSIMEGYLQTRFLAVNAVEINRDNPVADIDRFLDTLEESFLIAPGKSVDTCSRCKTLPGVARTDEKDDDKTVRLTLCPFCLLKLRANRLPEASPDLKNRLAGFLKGKSYISYPSIQEIAAGDIFEIENVANAKDPRGEEELSFKDIKKILKGAGREKELKTCHKYFAVVQADGDSLGKLIRGEEAKDQGESLTPNGLSQKLFEFAGRAEDVIRTFGGTPIYLGGDDILAFMPVFYKNRTVIDFIHDITALYKKTVSDKATISFGCNIAYYKFPLSTARQRAAGLLFGPAKEKKDSLAVCLTRHSGAELGFTLKIHGDEFYLFKEILSSVLNKTCDMPKGVHYNLRRFESLVAAIPVEKRLAAFFDNNFNEPEHGKYGEGIKAVREMLAHYMFDRPGGNSAEAVDAVLSILKFIKFLTGEETS